MPCTSRSRSVTRFVTLVAVLAGMAGVSVPNAEAVEHLPSCLNAPAGITTDPVGAAAASFVYDLAGRRSAATFQGVTSTSTYDAASQRTALVHATTTATLASYTAAYDQAGNTTAKSGPAGPLTYAYDAAARLVSETTAAGTTTYAYDLAGNRTSRTAPGGSTAYAYSPSGELTSVAGQPVTHDGAGNVTAIGTDTFAYDAQGRLVRASVAGTTQTATYDADGIRISRDAAPHLVDREGGLPTLVSDNSRAYLTADGFAAQLDATSATSLLADPQGSVATLADATGTPTGTATYNAFGTRTTTGATSALGFTGEEHDPTGLVHLRARTYSPSLGRFLQPDPIQPAGPSTLGWNRYIYANDNPLRFTDPTGAFPFSLGEQTTAAGVESDLQAGSGSGALAVGKMIINRLYTYLLRGYLRGYLRLSGLSPGAKCALGAVVDVGQGVATGGGVDPVGTAVDAVTGCIDSDLIPDDPSPSVKRPRRLFKSGAFVDLTTPERRRHILYGDETGGGHLWPGKPGKTPFPKNWTDDEIMHAVSDIATDPSLATRNVTGPQGSLYTKARNPALQEVFGVRNGVCVRVVVQPTGEGIVTAHPAPGMC